MSFEYRRAVIAMMLCSPKGLLRVALPSQVNFEKVLTDQFGAWQDLLAPANFWDRLKKAGAIQVLSAAQNLFVGDLWSTGEHPPNDVQQNFIDFAKSQDAVYLAGFRAGWEAA